jgi:transposase
MKELGRPTSFTTAKANRIVVAIRRGLPFKLAAAAGGISYNTFVRWRNDGSSPNAPRHLREFCNQVRSAESEAAQRFLGLIEAAAERTWQAAAWMLERRHPDLFGKSAEPPSRGMMDIDLDIHDDD